MKSDLHHGNVSTKEMCVKKGSIDGISDIKVL